jgi:hypothetical protein
MPGRVVPALSGVASALFLLISGAAANGKEAPDD